VKIIYLDLDGVLKVNGKFSKAAINNLQKILKAVPEAKIVVSSAWRSMGLKFVRDLLVDEGIDGDKIMRCTDMQHRTNRGHHIERDIDKHDIKKFVILDDKADMDQVLGHLIQTNTSVGLTSKDAQEAIKMLNS